MKKTGSFLFSKIITTIFLLELIIFMAITTTIIFIRYMASKNFIIMIFLTGILCIHTGCMYTPIPKYLKKQFNAFSKKENYTDTNLILTNNLYCIKLIYYRSPIYKDTIPILRTIDKGKTIKDSLIIGDQITNNNFIFFKNGFCVKVYINEIDKELDKNEHLKTKENKINYHSSIGSCGLYKLCGDTVKIKVLGRGSYLAGSISATEEWYKILKDKRLKLLSYKDLTVKDVHAPSSGSYLDSVKSLSSSFCFIKNIQITPDSCWLMNKRWFWKDKNEYKEWSKISK